MDNAVLTNLVLVVVLAIAVYTDIRYNKIYNGVCLSALLAGIVIHIKMEPFAPALYHSIGSALIALLVFLPFYIARGMAAGDVKLMAACAAILGWPDSVLAVGLSLMFGTIMGVAVFCIRSGVYAFFSRYWYLFKSILYTGGVDLRDSSSDKVASSRFPYAVAIAAGCLTARWMAIQS